MKYRLGTPFKDLLAMAGGVRQWSSIKSGDSRWIIHAGFAGGYHDDIGYGF